MSTQEGTRMWTMVGNWYQKNKYDHPGGTTATPRCHCWHIVGIRQSPSRSGQCVWCSEMWWTSYGALFLPAALRQKSGIALRLDKRLPTEFDRSLPPNWWTRPARSAPHGHRASSRPSSAAASYSSPLGTPNPSSASMIHWRSHTYRHQHRQILRCGSQRQCGWSHSSAVCGIEQYDFVNANCQFVLGHRMRLIGEQLLGCARYIRPKYLWHVPLHRKCWQRHGGPWTSPQRYHKNHAAGWTLGQKKYCSLHVTGKSGGPWWSNDPQRHSRRLHWIPGLFGCNLQSPQSLVGRARWQKRKREQQQDWNPHPTDPQWVKIVHTYG